MAASARARPREEPVSVQAPPAVQRRELRRAGFVTPAEAMRRQQARDQAAAGGRRPPAKASGRGRPPAAPAPAQSPADVAGERLRAGGQRASTVGDRVFNAPAAAGRWLAPSDGAGFVLALVVWGWVILPYLTQGGVTGVRNTWRAKFFNKGPDGSWLP